MIRPAVLAAAFSEDFRIAVRSAHAAGFAGIQLGPTLGSLDLISLSQSGNRELRSILRSNEIELASLRLDLGARGLGANADIDAALDRIESVMQSAAALQSPLLCVDLGPVPLEANSTFDTAMSELARRADRHGVTIAFRTDLAPFSALHRALKSIACPWFGIDLDPVAMLIDQWPRQEIFANLGSQIRHLRARDAILGLDRRTKPAVIGRGSVDWPQLLADLSAHEFHGWITIDPMDLPNRAAAAKAGLAALPAALS